MPDIFGLPTIGDLADAMEDSPKGCAIALFGLPITLAVIVFLTVVLPLFTRG